MRKAQGIEMNVMVMAALALIVLVVLIAVFTGKVQIVGQESQCIQRGGLCKVPSECEPGKFVRTAYECKTAGQICCMDPSKIS